MSTPTSAQATRSPLRFETNADTICLEALKRTDEIMTGVRGWFHQEARGGQSQKQSGIMSIARERSTSGGYEFCLRWGPKSQGMLDEMEERVGYRMTEFLSEDRRVGSSVAGVIAGRRIAQGMPTAPTGQNPGIFGEMLEILGTMSGETNRSAEAAGAGNRRANGGSDWSVGKQSPPLSLQELLEMSQSAEERLRETLNNPEMWVSYVMGFVEKGLQRSHGLLNAIGNGLESGLSQPAAPTKNEVIARQMADQVDGLDGGRVRISPASVPVGRDADASAIDSPKADYRGFPAH